MKIAVIAVIIIIMVGVIWFLTSDRSDDVNLSTATSETTVEPETNQQDTMQDTSDPATNVEAVPYIVHDWQGDLVDVSGGEASGSVEAAYIDGVYDLVATLENLPTPAGTDFYEGWIVRNDPSDVLSTGKIDLVDGNYTNTFQSEKDLLDHDFYVLTIEPDDGDPAPANHILEGTLTK
ncbi:anti-sigma factor [Patescibacteria group bacterium]|nr:anti-sigma factor [Patescibacteria group bacterium]